MTETVLIYASVPLWEYHNAESVELALAHLAQGDDVHILTCQGALYSCAANAKHVKRLCDLCVEQQRRARKILGKERITWHTVKLDAGEPGSFPAFASIAALRKFNIDGVPHGAFAASQLVDNIRDGYPEMEKYTDVCNKLLSQSVALFEHATKLITQIGARHVYIWNGRRPSDGPVIAAARKLGVPFTTHIWDYDEPWGFTRGFIAIPGSYFHDLVRIRDIVSVDKTAAPLTPAQRKEATSYIENLTPAGRRLFGANFRDTPLHFLSPEAHKIGIFTTSEWEFAGEPTWENRLYPSQWAGIEKIVTDPRLRSGVQFVVRLHPNLVNSPSGSGEWKTIRALQSAVSPRVHFVQPRDPVDSYRLLQACDTIVTFGSTIGIEASWQGKPVVLLSRAPYEGAGICYEPDSHDEAVRLLSMKLEPAAKDNLLRYAYLRLAGVYPRIELKHLRLDDRNRVRFGNYRLFRHSTTDRLRAAVNRIQRAVTSAVGRK